MREALAIGAASLVALWGVAHAIPTRAVVAGFGPISIDNRRIILQEWLVEAFAMWGIAALVIGVTVLDADGEATAWVYRGSAAALVAIGVLTAFTGGRTQVVWFKICTVLLTTTAALLLSASFL